MKNKYKSLVVVGSQWGDEGKGKITDYFAQKADAVVRFAGGDNAGHMIEFNHKRHKVTIVPSGVFNPKVKNIIGNGTVINLRNLVAEIKKLNDAQIDTSNVFVSDRAHLIFDWHILLDQLQEEQRQEQKIGTTKRGIGPTYSDKAARYGIRICDINQPNFKNILKENFDYHNQMITKVYNHEPLNFDDIYHDLMNNFNFIKNNIIDSGYEVSNLIDQNKFVLFEGAQGVLLDIDHGTYPFVTSSNCSANNASIGVGIHAKQINKVVGIVKAYNTRVGSGAMPTEIHDQLADKLRERGREYGSNTGKPRRIGWLDLVALKYAIRVGGIDELFLTLLDVLDTEKTIKICIAYQLDGKVIDSIPASDLDFKRCQPIYQEVAGWNQDISKVTSFDQLPDNAKNYIKKIQKIVKVPFLGFSVGPDRNQTILIKGEFDD
ncbi:adenylosuccinate synthase [Mycoplasma putrefaciens]|uniref:Adenylosuccinate synthetase n=1 Tax=Mycoplasma putrefaciens (strain ATCC 15718 / NCTC 10155 / C30 KS-1 / KS-1) TaxID=743965 RepID=A0A7U3ZS21_MYCPK|nr:adenylosuccinate synthase [Mycoplasma putrefaciens]AEM68471.1 adenylosuccinate synthetase [Mycoplasma putrefaciens KS1]